MVSSSEGNNKPRNKTQQHDVIDTIIRVRWESLEKVVPQRAGEDCGRADFSTRSCRLGFVWLSIRWMRRGKAVQESGRVGTTGKAGGMSVHDTQEVLGSDIAKVLPQAGLETLGQFLSL